MVELTRDGFVFEYEIKCLTQGFRDEVKKKVPTKWSGARKQMLKSTALVKGFGPSKFWFIIPEEIEASPSIPSWAGLMLAGPDEMKTVREAPWLHRRRWTKHAISVVRSINSTQIDLLCSAEKYEKAI